MCSKEDARLLRGLQAQNDGKVRPAPPRAPAPAPAPARATGGGERS